MRPGRRNPPPDGLSRAPRGGYLGRVIRTGFFAALLAPLCLLQAQVKLGCEVLAAEGFKPLRGKRVALLTNHTGVDARGRSTLDTLRAAPGVKLVALLAPEHGLTGSLPAGKEFPNGTDARTGLPVFSLYGPGPTRKPTPAMLKGIDVVVYDLQDIGVRSYTYISTLGQAMEACGAAGVEFVVLDRPNPLGGRRVEGPMVTDAYRTFVSRWDIPYVYGLTCGELARMINGERWITNRCRLTVVPMTGWKRTMTWRNTGLPFVPTSPNVRTPEAAFYLVATGILGELGGVSLGLGTDSPFQCIAAPWLNGDALARQLATYPLRGVRFTPVEFTPGRGAYQNQLVRGVRFRLTDPAHAPLVAINFYALDAVKRVGKRDLFAEAVKAGKNFSMFDKVNGTDATRKALQAGQSAAEIVASWKPGEEAFRRRREKYLLY